MVRQSDVRKNELGCRMVLCLNPIACPWDRSPLSCCGGAGRLYLERFAAESRMSEPLVDSRKAAATYLTHLLHACLGILLLVIGTLLVWRPLDANQDFWAHAAIGRWIWRTGHVPNQTLFLWTASEPWVYHSWLSQLTFYGLTNLGGPGVFPWFVLIFTTILALLPFALACWIWRWGGRGSSWMIVPAE